MIRVQGFLQISKGAPVQRLHGVLHRRIPGQHDGNHVGMYAKQRGKQLGAISIRQAYIQNSCVVKALFSPGYSITRRGNSFYLVSLGSQNALDDLQKIEVIVNYQYALSVFHIYCSLVASP